MEQRREFPITAKSGRYCRTNVSLATARMPISGKPDCVSISAIKKQLEATKAKSKVADDATSYCIVTKATTNKRTVRILPRGDFLNETGEVVTAALPSYLPKPTIEGREPNRWISPNG